MDSKRDSTVHDSFHRAGYDLEEDYFYRHNRELIEENRRLLDDARRLRFESSQQQAHWMHCPKCGAMLHEVESYGVKGDQCEGCGGAFFDKAELELMMKTHHDAPKSFTARLKRLLNEATRPQNASWTQIPI